jgi:hypothetical protein
MTVSARVRFAADLTRTPPAKEPSDVGRTPATHGPTGYHSPRRRRARNAAIRASGVTNVSWRVGTDGTIVGENRIAEPARAISSVG